MSDRRTGSPSNKVELLLRKFCPLTNGCIYPGFSDNTPSFTHILVFPQIHFFSIHLEVVRRMNSRKHTKLCKALHRPTFFDVLIPCLLFQPFLQVQRVSVVLSLRGYGAKLLKAKVSSKMQLFLLARHFSFIYSVSDIQRCL